jgi:hypothetical protein
MSWTRSLIRGLATQCYGSPHDPLLTLVSRRVIPGRAIGPSDRNGQYPGHQRSVALCGWLPGNGSVLKIVDTR